MQSDSQIPPDFSIGYGTEVEVKEGVGSSDIAAFLVVCSPLLIVAWLSYRRRKSAKER
jgi:hypothetical protein